MTAQLIKLNGWARLVLLVLYSSTLSVYAQNIGGYHFEDYSLQKNLKQNGIQYQFTVLDEDKPGVFTYHQNKFYYWYRAQHIISTQGASSGQLLHGQLVGFYPNKQLYEQGKYCKGLKNGEWKYWRANGTLLRTECWIRGEKRGRQLKFDKHGNIIETENIHLWSTQRKTSDSMILLRGKHKVVTLYDSTGSIMRKEEYKSGILHGYVYNFENDTLSSKTKYKNGEPIIKVDNEKQAEAEKPGLFKRLFNREEKSSNKKKEKKEKQEKIKDKSKEGPRKKKDDKEK